MALVTLVLGIVDRAVQWACLALDIIIRFLLGLKGFFRVLP